MKTISKALILLAPLSLSQFALASNSQESKGQSKQALFHCTDAAGKVLADIKEQGKCVAPNTWGEAVSHEHAKAHELKKQVSKSTQVSNKTVPSKEGEKVATPQTSEVKTEAPKAETPKAEAPKAQTPAK